MATILLEIISLLNTQEQGKVQDYISTYKYFERLQDGHSNLVYAISNGEDKRLLKIYKRCDSNHENYETIIQQKLGVPKTFIENKYFRIDEFIENKKVDFEKNLNQIIVSLKNFHNLDIKKVEICSYSELVYRNIFLLKDARIRKIMLEVFRQFKPIQPECVIHNDLVGKNMLCRKDDGKINLIDFEFSCYGEKDLDLACLIQGIRESMFSLDDLLVGKQVPQSKYREVIEKYYGYCHLETIIKIKTKELYIFFFKLLWALNNENCKELDIKKYKKYLLEKLEFNHIISIKFSDGKALLA